MIANAARTGGKWGLVLGVALCLWTLLLHVLGFYTTRLGAGQVADMIVTILPLVAVALALLERRRATARLQARDALLTGLALGVVSALISVPFLWWYHTTVNPEWVNLLVQWRTQQMTTAGSSAQEIAAAVESLRRGGTNGAQAAAGVIGSVMISLGFSLVGWLILRVFPRRKPGVSA
jgi:hypothetical protein